MKHFADGWKRLNELAGDERYSAMYINALNIQEPLNECDIENLMEMEYSGQKENVNAHDLRWFSDALKKAGAVEVKESLSYGFRQCLTGELVEPDKPLQFKVFYKGKVDRKRLLELIGN